MSGRRVLMVGNYEPDRQYSMIGYADGLASGLRPRGWDVTVLQPPVRVNRHPEWQLCKWAAYIDKIVLFPRQLDRAASDYDLVHLIDQGNGFYGPTVARHRHLATIHDLLAMRAALGQIPGWTVGPSGRRLQSMIRRGLQSLSNFVVISSMTKRDFLSVVKPDPTSLRLIYNGLVAPFVRQTATEADARLKPLGLTDGRPFALAIGSNAYKNHGASVRLLDGLRETRELADLRLAIVSKFRDPDAAAAADALNLWEHIVYLHDLPRETIEALYSRARLLLFPSKYEGFGLPIIEAQSCGCPVVTTDAEPMNEVAGTSAVLVDLAEVTASVPTIVERLCDTEKWVSEGRENIKRFTFDRWVDEYSDAYSTLLT